MLDELEGDIWAAEPGNQVVARTRLKCTCGPLDNVEEIAAGHDAGVVQGLQRVDARQRLRGPCTLLINNGEQRRPLRGTGTSAAHLNGSGITVAIVYRKPGVEVGIVGDVRH